MPGVYSRMAGEREETAMRSCRRLLLALAILVAWQAPARCGISRDQLRTLLDNAGIAGNARTAMEARLRRIDQRRKKKQAEERKKAKEMSLEAVKEAFEKGKKAYGEQLYSVAYLHFSSVASCGLGEAAKMAAEAKTKVIETEGMAGAKLESAELLLLKGEAAVRPAS